jgi:molybdopterin molybdotransferase
VVLLAFRHAAAGDDDVCIHGGGMSEGEEDHMVAAMRAEGRIDVWKIAAKPGKPLAFGAVGEASFIGLPGNPVSVWVGMLTLVAPFLRRCQAMKRIEPPRQMLRADFEWAVSGSRLEFVRVRRNEQGGLDRYATQDSAIISSAVWCDGLVAVPAGTAVRPGDQVEFIPGPGWQP